MGAAGAGAVATGQRPQPGLPDLIDAGHLSRGVQPGIRRGVRGIRRAPRRSGDGGRERLHVPPATTVRPARPRRTQGPRLDRRRDRPTHRRRRAGDVRAHLAGRDAGVGRRGEARLPGTPSRPRVGRPGLPRRRGVARTPAHLPRERRGNGLPTPSEQLSRARSGRRLRPPDRGMDQARPDLALRCARRLLAGVERVVARRRAGGVGGARRRSSARTADVLGRPRRRPRRAASSRPPRSTISSPTCTSASSKGSTSTTRPSASDPTASSAGSVPQLG